MASGKRRLTRNKLIIASMLAVFLIPVLHGVFFRKGKLAQAPVFGICSDATAGASEGVAQLGSVVQIEPVVPIKTCPDGTGNKFLPAGNGEDLEVTGECVVNGQVTGGQYWYRNVNIYTKANSNTDGTLQFEDAVINFHAKSILVENKGSLMAGVDQPIGTRGGKLTIYLYGKDQGVGGLGIVCKSNPKTCGVPNGIWDSNGRAPMPLGNGITDRFYQYTPLPFDNGTDTMGNAGYFGYKVLAVSFGGTLKLFGKKGAVYRAEEQKLEIKDPGRSWGRLDGTILGNKEVTKLKVAPRFRLIGR